jgi:Glyoxalase-like domain
MALQLHHVFVCTSVGAPEAADLLDAGLSEGSANTHPGQGTASRRFFFESGFLELLWVHDEREAQSTLTAPTKLWDRWVERGRAANPFGICFSSADGPDSILPFPTWAYRPDYLSDGRHLLFADDLHLLEPEVFVLSWPQAQSSPETERMKHPLGLCKMQFVSVGLPDPASISRTLGAIRDAGLVEVHYSPTPELVLKFTSQNEVQHSVPALGLSMVGRPAAPPNKSLERTREG